MRVLDLDPDIASHLESEGGNWVGESFDHLLDRFTQILSNFVKTLHDQALIDRIEAGQEVGGMVRLDVPALQRIDREVFEVEGHDDVTFTTDGSGKNIPVFGIVRNAHLNGLKNLDQCFWKVMGDLLSPIGNQILRPS